jgi:hypothetical protein
VIVQFEYYVETMNRKYRWIMYPDQPAVGSLMPLALTPLMAMTRGAPAFAFCGKGAPSLSNRSPELEKILADGHWLIHSNWLTRSDLIKKSAELFLIGDVEAQKYRLPLINLIKRLPTFDTDPGHQRIVYWAATN